MTGRLRLGAWLVCLGLLAAGLYLAVVPAPGKTTFERVDGRLLEVNTQDVGTPVKPDRMRKLVLTGARCVDYDYLDSWAKQVGLPVITDLDATKPMTVYADARSCSGFNVGKSAPLRALVFEGKLYATAAFQHPPNDRLANLPAALLLLLTGAAGVILLVRRPTRRGEAGTLE
ncbi:MAG: hypothetical protein M3Z98_10730 [Candidatus Dormibacteraeota bacterium]|nr:hypothetical protein [Candidatus Dormibacteraeota bacterium]